MFAGAPIFYASFLVSIGQSRPLPVAAAEQAAAWAQSGPACAWIFFGRDAMIVRGLDRIRGLVESGVEKLLVVLGSSGSGKSSLRQPPHE